MKDKTGQKTISDKERHKRLKPFLRRHRKCIKSKRKRYARGEYRKKRSTLEQRLQFIKLASLDADECALWPFTTKQGMPSLWINGRSVSATRYSLNLFEPIQEEGYVCKPCNENSLCINPHHLDWIKRVDTLGEHVNTVSRTGHIEKEN